MDQPVAATPAAPAVTPDQMTVEQATTERGMLMADAAWRSRAMNPASREYRALQDLDLRIAGMSQQADAKALAEPESAQPAFSTPAQASEYDLHIPEGMEADPAGLQAWTEGMRTAGVDGDLAAVAWQIANHHMQRELDPVEVNQQHDQALMQIRGRFGDKADEMLEAANKAGRALFEKLPASLTQGASYAEFMLATGLANSATLVEMLAERAAASTSHA